MFKATMRLLALESVFYSSPGPSTTAHETIKIYSQPQTLRGRASEHLTNLQPEDWDPDSVISAEIPKESTGTNKTREITPLGE